MAFSAAAAALLATAACGSASTPHHHAATAKPANVVPAAQPAHGGPICPLTGQPAPGGRVPARPALAVKIGNDAPALPQSGLDHADVVFEEPIEGAITRLIAVFQCQEASQVGPIRSTRYVDTEVLARLGHPLFAFAGGIIPDENLVANSNAVALNALGASASAFYRGSARVPPENLYGSTQSIWALSSSHQPPPSLFSYSATAPAGPAVASATLSWSSYYSVGWSWNSAAGVFDRSEYGTAEHTSDGNAVTAVNVLIMRVQTYPGPYAEDSSGEHGVRSVLYGSGPATLLRGGHSISGTWSSPSVRDPFKFTDSAGGRMTFARGNTWVEFVPVAGSVSLTP